MSILDFDLELYVPEEETLTTRRKREAGTCQMVAYLAKRPAGMQVLRTGTSAAGFAAYCAAALFRRTCNQAEILASISGTNGYIYKKCLFFYSINIGPSSINSAETICCIAFGSNIVIKGLIKRMIKIKRTYDEIDSGDGTRFLVDKVWPRGVKKEDLEMAAWLKDVAPSDELRKWFDHDPNKWEEFQKRYKDELREKPKSWEPILETARQGEVTLLYSAKDVEHNNAVVLKGFLENRLQKPS